MVSSRQERESGSGQWPHDDGRQGVYKLSTLSWSDGRLISDDMARVQCVVHMTRWWCGVVAVVVVVVIKSN